MMSNHSLLGAEMESTRAPYRRPSPVTPTQKGGFDEHAGEEKGVADGHCDA